jgi:DNA polymerase-4
MDAFYASVEQLDHPEWRGKPVMVAGAAAARGVVSAASYEARAYGVRSAMPTARAIRLCPRGIFVPPRLDRYGEVSEKIFAIFARVTPLVQPVSLDEAFLDVTGCQRLHGDPVSIAERIRETIRKEAGLTASVGVASCRFAAKIASDLNKPDGLTVIREDELRKRLASLPVGKIWGVGPVTGRQLARIGIETIGQLAEWPEEALTMKLGSVGTELHRLARGEDDSRVIPGEAEKSISSEHTFAADVADLGELEIAILEQAERVAERLRKRKLFGRTVFLKLRYDDFSTVTRRKTLVLATRLADVIHEEAKKLLRERSEAGKRPIRLVGVGMAGLVPAAGGEPERQGALFAASGKDSDKLDRLARAEDAIRAKLGPNAIRRASIRFHKPT